MSVLLSLIVVSAPLEPPVELEAEEDAVEDAVADEEELLHALTVNTAHAVPIASTAPPRRSPMEPVRGLSRRLPRFLCGIAIS
jgi:hypothetical protein